MTCERVLFRDGLTVGTDDGGLERHPLLLTAERSWADCRKIEALFGLSPSARRGLNITETEPADVAAGAKRARFFGKGA